MNAPTTTGSSEYPNMVITFTDDADWRSAINEVLVDGDTFHPSRLNIEPGKITINWVAMPPALYTITIKAEGYNDKVVPVELVND